MKILGFTVHGFHFKRRRQRKVTSKLDSIANAALLDAAVKNPEVLAQVVNKYGKIQLPRDDTIATLVEKASAKVRKEAVQIILNSRRQELVNHVGDLIDIVTGLNSVTGRRQHGERSFEGATPGKPNIARRRLGMEQSREASADPSVLIRSLAMLTVLEGIINQQRKKQTRDSLEE